MKKILVVDENRGQAMHIANTLEDAGYAVLLSFSPRGTFKILAENQAGIDWIVLGRKIEKMTRENLIREIRERFNKKIPIISNFITSEELIKCINQELKLIKTEKGEKKDG